MKGNKGYASLVIICRKIEETEPLEAQEGSDNGKRITVGKRLVPQISYALSINTNLCLTGHGGTCLWSQLFRKPR
jgi:hypothetical protein